MANSDTDPVLFLSGESWEVAHLVRGLIEDRGIPVIVHDPQQDHATSGLGHLVGAMWPGPSFPEVYIPRGAFEIANQILEEAWGADWREKKPHDEEQEHDD